MRISLVGTVHAESGLANVVELRAILERLKPDVLFVEIPPECVGQYCNGSHATLESITVASYRENHEFAVIPVDLSKPDDSFFRNAQEMFDKVERTSSDYRRMMDIHSLNTRLDGFPYLNSDRCIQAWIDIRSEILATLNWVRDPRLHQIFNQWNIQNELRESEMVKNIADVAVYNDFVHGVFLVGAAHRKSIIDKAREGVGIDIPSVKWKLDALSR